MTRRLYNGQLEVDLERGVIYFHDVDLGMTTLRICSLPPIGENVIQIDITHMVGTQYTRDEVTTE